jgi:hypothetical protein
VVTMRMAQSLFRIPDGRTEPLYGLQRDIAF